VGFSDRVQGQDLGDLDVDLAGVDVRADPGQRRPVRFDQELGDVLALSVRSCSQFR
jgi:hypothetical protein